MIVVDITRLDNKNKENDLLVGNLTIDTKKKVIDYIYDYSLANLNIDIDKELLDYKLNMESFSLKEFLSENYNINTNKDLIIHSAKTDKEHCLFLKFDNDIDNPVFFIFHKNDLKKAHSILRYLVNDSLINKYQDNLQEYDRLKLVNDIDYKTYPDLGIKGEIMSLYNGGLFLEELLNNVCSLKQLKNNINGINI